MHPEHSSQGSLQGLAHIGVFTTDIQQSTAFYCDILGFDLEHQQQLPGPQGITQLAFVNTGSCIVELIQPADTAPLQARQDGIIDHIAIAVTDIDPLVKRLEKQDVPFETTAIRQVQVKQGAKNIFLRGPSGERLEFFEEIP